MTTLSFTEDQIRFEFDPALWLVVKWDDSDEYRHGIRKLNGTLSDPVHGTSAPEGSKAVDFIGIHQGTLYLFEVKDFRGSAAANAFRQERELPLELGLKVRDTLAGLVGVSQRRRPPTWIDHAVRAMYDQERPIHVVAWLAEDPPRTNKNRRVQDKTTGVRSDQLQQRLAWLTRKAWVDNPLDPFVVLPGIEVRPVRASP